MEQVRPGWRAVGSVVIVGLLAVSALQLHALESRLVTQSQQLRVLGEATERMARCDQWGRALVKREAGRA
ncbi:MAG: hypothetical protein ABI895_19970 [Deltaproteobacteria bacterium]